MLRQGRYPGAHAIIAGITPAPESISIVMMVSATKEVQALKTKSTRSHAVQCRCGQVGSHLSQECFSLSRRIAILPFQGRWLLSSVCMHDQAWVHN